MNHIFFKNKIFLILLFILFLGTITLSFSFKNNKFYFESENYTTYKDNYKILVNYPVFNISKVNKKIKKILKDEKDSFFDKIKNDINSDNELNINYSYTIKDNIYSFHLRSYSYTNKNNDYNRYDEVFYIDKETNKVIKIDDLIINDEIYNVFEKFIYDYLDTHQYIDLYDEKTIEKNLKGTKGKYQLISFSDNVLFIDIPPHVISPYDSNINIAIEYKYVKEYLNDKYFNSLETVKNEVPVFKVKKIRRASAFKNKKLVALTFDDGPSKEKTLKLVEELNKRDARVSFFMLGELASKQPELVKMIYDSGHTIASHTYDHKNLKKLKDEQLKFEVDYTNEILKNITGEDVKFLRPPYGSYNKNILKNVDMTFILWSVDTLDWKLRDVDKITEEIVKSADDGEIILLHDIHAETVEAAIKAVDILQEQGYAFVSLDELATYKNINIKSNTAYRYMK